MFPIPTNDSLRHWQTWEAEYEGFKEELLALGDDCTDAELVTTFIYTLTSYTRMTN